MARRGNGEQEQHGEERARWLAVCRCPRSRPLVRGCSALWCCQGCTEGVERIRFLSPTASQRHNKHWSGYRLHRVPRMNHIACEFTFPYSVSYVLIRE